MTMDFLLVLYWFSIVFVIWNMDHQKGSSLNGIFLVAFHEIVFFLEGFHSKGESVDESSAVPIKYERDRGEKVFWYHNREKIRLWNPFWSHKKLKEARTEALRTKKTVSPSLHLFIQITVRGAGLSRFASQNYFLQYCWVESAPLRLYIEYLVFIFGCSVLSQVFQ